MKRKADIARELVRLRAESHPPDFYAELRRIVVLDSCLPVAMAGLLGELKAAWPESFNEAVRGTTLPARRRKQESMVGAFLASQMTQLKWCVDNNVEPKALTRARKRYKNDPDFRQQADGWKELFEHMGWGQFKK